MNEPAAPRVTYAETCARQFLLWGYHKEKGADLPTSYPERLAWAHRWPNLWFQRKHHCPHCNKWFTEKGGEVGDKLIDITGCGDHGMSVAVEVKAWDSRKGTRFEFSSIKLAQAQFLTRHPGWSFLWLGAIVPSQDRRRENWRMFLIPWPEWLHMQETYTRQFKNGRERLWQSISLPWIVYWFHQYELVELANRVGGKLERAWFTLAEIKQPLETWQDGYPTALPLSWILPQVGLSEPEEG